MRSGLQAITSLEGVDSNLSSIIALTHLYPIDYYTALRYACKYMEKLTVEQAGSLGGKKRWKGKSAKSRSDIMREVANARWKKAATK